MPTAHPAIDTTRRQLGELGALAQRTQADERAILERALQRREEVEGARKAARAAAIAGDTDAEQEYADLVDERGRLDRVISNAQVLLADSDAS